MVREKVLQESSIFFYVVKSLLQSSHNGIVKYYSLVKNESDKICHKDSVQ